MPVRHRGCDKDDPCLNDRASEEEKGREREREGGIVIKGRRDIIMYKRDRKVREGRESTITKVIKGGKNKRAIISM